MNKLINYKGHDIILDGITAVIMYQGASIYKTRFIDTVEAVKSLKSFINLRLDQIKRDRSIDIYV